MGVSHHFVNLVSWEFQSPTKNCVLYADSITFKLAGIIFAGKNLRRNSGLKFVNDNRVKHFLVLGTKEGKNEKILPFFKSQDEIEAFAKEYVKYNDTNVNLLISISSPKQDYLAYHLHRHGYLGDIYCLGAALNQRYRNASRLDRYGLVWFRMALSNPLRFVNKIGLTLCSFIGLLCSKSKREKFRSFILDNFK
jgi:hypothetical protein